MSRSAAHFYRGTRVVENIKIVKKYCSYKYL